MKIGLVDVDETLILTKRTGDRSEYIINQRVLDKLKKDGVTDLYLFTNMSMKDLSGMMSAIQNGHQHIS